MVVVQQLDHGLTHEQPLHVGLRSARRSNPVTYYNLHPGFEVGILLSGGEEHLFQQTSAVMERGDAWLIAAWELHGLRSSPKRGRVLSLTFLPEFLGEAPLDGMPWLDLFTADPAQRPRVRSQWARERILAIGEMIHDEAERRLPGWRDEIRLDLLRLLLTLRREWSPPSRAARCPGPRETALHQIAPALRACQTDPSARTTTGEAAASCGISERHFCRLFRRTTGLSFARFRLNARTEAAARLLLVSKWPVEHIAKQNDFANASHLHRAFVKRYGCTPSEYRKKCRLAPASNCDLTS